MDLRYNCDEHVLILSSGGCSVLLRDTTRTIGNTSKVLEFIYTVFNILQSTDDGIPPKY